jgi:hypothetical protein
MAQASEAVAKAISDGVRAPTLKLWRKRPKPWRRRIAESLN